MVFVQLSYDLM